MKVAFRLTRFFTVVLILTSGGMIKLRGVWSSSPTVSNRSAFTNYFRTISMYGNETNGSEQSAKVNVNDVCSVQAYSADPSGIQDSTKAIQSTINNCACVSSICTRAIYFPAGTYQITQLNLTDLKGLTLLADGTGAFPTVQLNCTEPVNNAGVCLDFSGDIGNVFRNFLVNAIPAHAPRVAVLMAKTARNNSENFYWEDITVIQNGGDFGIFNVGGEIWNCYDCYWNGGANVANAMLSYPNTPKVTSPFVTLLNSQSMTTVTFYGSSFGGTGPGAPLVFDPGNAGIGDIHVYGGYCNNPNGIPCITDYSAADTGGLNEIILDGVRDEPQGASPGELVLMNHAVLIGLRIANSSWTSRGPTTNPAFETNADFYNSSIDIVPSNETDDVSVCNPSHNILGITITQYNRASRQKDSCPGAAFTGGVYGSGSGSYIDAPIIGTVPTTLANLSACTTEREGNMSRATTCSSCANGTVCSGTGKTHCEVVCNGTSWIQMGF